MTRARIFLAVALASTSFAQDLGPTLTRPAGAEAPPASDGFIKRWLVLEPIPTTGLTDSAVQAAVKKEYSYDQFSVIPRDGDKVTVGGSQLTWHAIETKLYNVNLFHFARAVGKPTSNVLFWAVTIVNVPQDMPGVRLAIGSNAASVWWVNGREVIGIYGDRQTVIDDGVSRRLTLRKGPNVIRAAIVNGGGATDFCARFLDAEDQPLLAFKTTLNRTGTAAAATPLRAPIERQLTFTPYRATGIYDVGDTVASTVTPGPSTAKYSWKWTIRRNNAVALKEGKLDLSSGSDKIEIRGTEPGMQYAAVEPYAPSGVTCVGGNTGRNHGRCAPGAAEGTRLSREDKAASGCSREGRRMPSEQNPAIDTKEI